LILDEAIEKAVFTRIARGKKLRAMLLIKLEKCEKAFKFEKQLFEVYV